MAAAVWVCEPSRQPRRVRPGGLPHPQLPTVDVDDALQAVRTALGRSRAQSLALDIER